MAIDTDGLSEADFREMAAKLEAAHAMLAVLEFVLPSLKSMDEDDAYGCDVEIERVEKAIAAAKAAGISPDKAEG